MNQISRDIEALVKRWISAKRRLDEAEKEVNSAQCSLRNAINDLGKTFCPPDAQVGEKFTTWVHKDLAGVGRERLLVVTKRTSGNDYNVTWRD